MDGLAVKCREMRIEWISRYRSRANVLFPLRFFSSIILYFVSFTFFRAAGEECYSKRVNFELPILFSPVRDTRTTLPDIQRRYSNLYTRGKEISKNWQIFVWRVDSTFVYDDKRYVSNKKKRVHFHGALSYFISSWKHLFISLKQRNIRKAHK